MQRNEFLMNTICVSMRPILSVQRLTRSTCLESWRHSYNTDSAQMDADQKSDPLAMPAVVLFVMVVFIAIILNVIQPVHSPWNNQVKCKFEIENQNQNQNVEKRPPPSKCPHGGCPWASNLTWNFFRSQNQKGNKINCIILTGVKDL